MPRITRIFVRRYLGGKRAEWGCYAQDHTWTGPLFAKREQRQRIGEDGHRFIASWWSFKKGGVTDICPRCSQPNRRDPNRRD